ncbi:TIGR03086 family metal-binding protein [Nocardia huaxiensis]|uniref:TIGR03086 family metal-binding protein n=1 Tax=Nocardia huaxiensis TaxID=2755382 RepID=UPI001E3DF637|nr:TIGR03086 family metal-binding protein [Nocardia huaxiensis]UFS95700.1 TIGR03086 family metal-binding protein [Nocardia huaxiensis]
MADKDPALDLMERAVAQMADVIAAIRPDQAELPTPCENWPVRRVLGHLLGQILPNFTVAARGATPDWQASEEEFGPDWAAEFRTRAAELLAAWHSADLDGEAPVPGGGTAPLRARTDQQITEFAMHAWDLTRATGQDRELDPELAEHGLAWSKRIFEPEFRGTGKAFGLEIPVPDDASAYDRLAGWFGRDPHWKPGLTG